MIESLHNLVFYEKPEVVSSAPGKINLMGEHTHHSGGFIFSIAVNQRVYVSISSRLDDKFVVYSNREVELEIFTKKSLDKIEKGKWSTPVKGVIKSFLDNGFDLPGFNVCIASDISTSVELANSSATAAALSFAIRRLQNIEIEDIELLHLCERANKSFSPSYETIFDCMASAMAKDKTGILIDCRTLKYEYAPISKNLKILIIDTGKKEPNTFSQFLKRKSECDSAFEVISSLNPQVHSLRDLTLDELKRYSNFLDKTLTGKVRYVVGENERTLSFVAALRRGDLSMAGKLMFDSHLSLRNEYEIISPEIDTIVDISATIDGVIGAKLFGNCSGAVVMTIKEKTGEAIRIISEKFQELFRRKLKIYVTSPENGVEVSFKS
jgi:galactokinase